MFRPSSGSRLGRHPPDLEENNRVKLYPNGTGLSRNLLTHARQDGRIADMDADITCDLSERLLNAATLPALRAKWREEGKRVVFTNGCFDILHLGHVTYLSWARAQGDILVVGLNSDASVRRNKGPKRPIVGERDRAALLLSLRCVDYVCIFDEDTPYDLISLIVPDVLVKGRDWAGNVVGSDIVEAAGGRVALADLVAGRSTTGIIECVLDVYGQR